LVGFAARPRPTHTLRACSPIRASRPTQTQESTLAAHTAGHPALNHEGQADEHLLLRFELAAEQSANPPRKVLIVGHARILTVASMSTSSVYWQLVGDRGSTSR